MGRRRACRTDQRLFDFSPQNPKPATENAPGTKSNHFLQTKSDLCHFGETDDGASSDEGPSSNELEGESDMEGSESGENDSESHEKDNVYGEERDCSPETLLICSYSSIAQRF